MTINGGSGRRAFHHQVNALVVVPAEMGPHLRQKRSHFCSIVFQVALTTQPYVEKSEFGSRNAHTEFLADL